MVWFASEYILLYRKKLLISMIYGLRFIQLQNRIFATKYLEPYSLGLYCVATVSETVD